MLLCVAVDGDTHADIGFPFICLTFFLLQHFPVLGSASLTRTGESENQAAGHR